jgi:hypothetical protein
MSLHNWLDWLAVFGYLAITVFVMYRVFLTNSDR